jgi:hypothetical protein
VSAVCGSNRAGETASWGCRELNRGHSFIAATTPVTVCVTNEPKEEMSDVRRMPRVRGRRAGVRVVEG